MEKQKSSIDLVDFQKRLNANLEDAARQGEVSSLLGFKTAGRNFLIDLGDLREVDSVPVPEQIQRLALVKPWVLGISNFKGYIYTLVDLQLFLGRGSTSQSMSARALLVHQRFLAQAAIVVPEISGLVSKVEMQQVSGWKSAEPWVVSGFKSVDGEIWELVDLQALSESREMMDIELA